MGLDVLVYGHASVPAGTGRGRARRRGSAVAPHGRILLVEDIDINQRLAFALLDARGHSVDIVGDGAEAVAAVAERAYDLVLMDVQMPGMDGMTATRLIRGAGRHDGARCRSSP